MPGDERHGDQRQDGQRPERAPPARQLAGERAERHSDDVGEHAPGADQAQRAGARAGPAARVAATDATDQNAPVAKAVTNRAASSSAKLLPRATTTCPAANTTRASSSVVRRGIRRVSSAIVGAPTTMPSREDGDEQAGLGHGHLEVAGDLRSRPATTNSVVSMRNVPTAST